MAEQEGTSDGGRMSTGVPGLDELLHGGLVRGGVYLVMGRPGTGKTTLGNHMCFSHVARGGKAVYFTLLAESHSRMLASLQNMKFFDPEPVGSSLVYLGGYVVLREGKLPGLLSLLRRVIRDERATLLVVDGLSTAQAMAASDVAVKEFIAELQVLSGMSECTTLLLANLSAEEARGPEHSMVDGLMELTLDNRLDRPVREIEVLKFRGSNHFLGRHDMEISSAGVTVRPRIEDVAAQYMPGARASSERISTGIAQLDAMAGGGLLSGSATMLLGFAGSGKSSLCAHFLQAGVDRGENALYFGFYESPERFLEGAATLGLDLRSHVADGRLGIIWQPPLRYGLDRLADLLLDDVRARGVKRVVIDGLDGFRQAAQVPERTIRFVSALLNILRALDVTTFVTEETNKLFGPEVELRISGISGVVDNIVLTEYVDVGPELRRLVSIVKQRGVCHETQIRELSMGSDGIRIAEDTASAGEILARMHAPSSFRRRAMVKKIGRGTTER